MRGRTDTIFDIYNTYNTSSNMGTIARATRWLQAPQLVAKEQARSGVGFFSAPRYTESIVFPRFAD